ncbi:GntR family transcriptional regulator [Alicyclobacillus macrosporangiidus]|uniref:GntR family transcriptional regulator n=1 Tax=Alicyclobacillus macrosporangiidus TaxID=392015 RepID=UPI0004977195|nr:GntR family transcriptional regulator [Alicyclobacillus macrosporangiidus]
MDGNSMAVQRPEPLYQQVYRIVRQRILDGVYKPGEVLSESGIAQQLQVSRTPVREALRQLISERLVTADGPEMAVANPTRDEFIDLYTCRTALEMVVAERAARLATADDVAEMEAALRDAEAAIEEFDHARVHAANTRFHDLLVSCARMPMLSALLDTLRGPILIARRRILADSVDTEREILAEHRALLAAVQAGDAEAAQAVMRRHMANDLGRGLRLYDETPG